MLAVMQIRTPRSRIRLWLPLFLLWLLLLPFALLLLPFAAIGLALMGLRPFRSLGAGLDVLSSLSGTCVDVQHRNADVFVKII